MVYRRMSSRNQEIYSASVQPDAIVLSQGFLARLLSISTVQQKVIYTFATSMAMFGAFAIQGILLARILGRYGRGEYAAAVLFPQILLYVGLLGGIEIVARYAGQTNASLIKLRRAAFRLGMVTGCITMLAVIVFSLTCVPAAKSYLIGLCLLCSLALPFQHIHQITIAVDRGSNGFSRYNRVRLFGTLVFPAMLLVCWLMNVQSLKLICLLFVASAIMGAIPCLWRLDRSLSPAEPSQRTLLKEGRPYAVAMFAGELFERLDVALIFWWTSLATQGSYAAIVPAAHVLIVIPNALGLFTFNIGAKHGHVVSLKETNLAMVGMLVFQLVSTLAFALFIGKLILLLYGEDFRPAIPLAYALIPAVAIKGFLQAAEGYLKGRGKPLIGTYARLLGAAIMLLFVVLTFGKFDCEGLSIPLGACVAQVVCFICIVAAVYVDVVSRNRQGGLSS